MIKKIDNPRFVAGQVVHFVRKTIDGGSIARIPYGPFKIIRLLPQSEGKNLYRMESFIDLHHRVAAENELELHRQHSRHN
ncbi:MAG: hypothetical protein ACO3MJ_08375 [Alphaproteobacteria bacterium]